MSQRDESKVPPAKFIAPSDECDDIFEIAMQVVGLDDGFSTAVQRGYAVRTENGQELDVHAYATGFMDALSLAATLRIRDWARAERGER